MAIALLALGLAAASLQSTPPPAKQPAPPPPPQQAAAPAKKPKRVVTDLSTLHLTKTAAPANQAPGGSRGPAATLALCAPASGSTVSPIPLFEWQTSANAAAKVTFSLLTASGDVVEELDATGTSLQYPPGAAPLVPGQTYSWKVSGGGLDKLPDPITLDVLKPSATLMQELTAAGSDPLDRAQAYLHAGLWYDTIATLRQGLATHPQDPLLNEQLTLFLTAVGCSATP